MRWFVAIYFKDPEIQACLDAIILLANPFEKDSAHITIQGPFESHSGEDLKARDLEGTRISVVGVSNFFSDAQNTVFLECGSDEVRKYWKKPDYPFRPHITLYDGKSREFAEKLYERMRQHRMFFSLEVGEVKVIRSMPGQRAFGLWFNVDLNQIEKMTGESLRVLEVAQIPEWRRLMLIDRLCGRLMVLTRYRAQAGSSGKREVI